MQTGIHSSKMHTSHFSGCHCLPLFAMVYLWSRGGGLPLRGLPLVWGVNPLHQTPIPSPHTLPLTRHTPHSILTTHTHTHTHSPYTPCRQTGAKTLPSCNFSSACYVMITVDHDKFWTLEWIYSKGNLLLECTTYEGCLYNEKRYLSSILM